MSRVVIIGGLAESLVNFRGDLIKFMVSAGYEVIAMAGHTDTATKAMIEALGVSFRPYPVERNGMNPCNDLQTLYALRVAFSEIKPDVVLAYTIKPVIFGGLALRTLRLNVRFYALITGLGLAFQPGGFKQKLLSGLVTCLYRWALVRADKVIFQNKDNQRVFTDHQIIDEQRCVLVSGSGVNLKRFDVASMPQGSLIFLTIARLLGDKGLREYAEAAQNIKARYPDINFQLVGPVDPSPDGISISEVMRWQNSGALQYLGSTDDVRPYIAQCHIYVLPSYHEGMPRTVLEAMAMGRPIITTDAPGCRETVVDGDNGFLVPIKDVTTLVEAMERFILKPELLEMMGKRSRKIAEERFDVNKVNNDILQTMKLN